MYSHFGAFYTCPLNASRIQIVSVLLTRVHLHLVLICVPSVHIEIWLLCPGINMCPQCAHRDLIAVSSSREILLSFARIHKNNKQLQKKIDEK